MAAAPGQVLLLWAARFIASNQGINQMLDTAGGAQESRLVGGSQVLSIKLARQLGSAVILKSPVTKIEHRSWQPSQVVREHAAMSGPFYFLLEITAVAITSESATSAPSAASQLTPVV